MKASWILQGRSPRRFLPVALVCLFLSTVLLSLLTLAPVTAQTVLRSQDVWQQVYKLDPELPLENQYVSKETGKVSETNTLVSRFVRYHSFTKGRPPLYRLDWKLTLADYLGANDRISVSVYPGADTLRPNPMAGDVAAIQKLTRAQRETLVDTLVTIFNQAAAEAAPAPSAPDSPQAPAQPNASPSPVPPRPAPRTVAPQPAPQTQPQREPRPGDAELLLSP